MLQALSAECAVNGEALIFAPTVDHTWVTGSDDAAGIVAVLDAIEQHLGSGSATTPYEFRQLLFGWPWVMRGGTPQRWQVPPGHLLAERIAALDARLEKRRGSSSAFAEASCSLPVAVRTDGACER